MILQLAGQHIVGKIVLGNSQKSGSILVDAMHDSGAQFAVDTGKVIAHGMEQTVDQRIVLMSRRRMHHQTLGLVDHQNILILVDDVQRHFRGFDVHFLGLGDGILHRITDIQFVIFLSGLAVALHQPLINELLGSAAA